MEEIEIDVPEGYEIDRENSTFEHIRFKKKEAISWDTLGPIRGFYIDAYSNIAEGEGFSPDEHNRNVFATEDFAKSSLAMAQLSQVVQRYESYVENPIGGIMYHFAHRTNSEVAIAPQCRVVISPWCFAEYNDALAFVQNNKELLKEYFMIS